MESTLVALVIFGKKSAEQISVALNVLNIEYFTVLPYEIPMYKATHIILSGGPKHVYDTNMYPLPQWIIDSNVPVLGICYGMQLIAHTFGGKVIHMPYKEKGFIDITEIIDGEQITTSKWMNREDRVVFLTNKFDIIGVTKFGHIATFTDHKKWYAVQYHPEVNLNYNINVFNRFLNGSWQEGAN